MVVVWLLCEESAEAIDESKLLLVGRQAQGGGQYQSVNLQIASCVVADKKKRNVKKRTEKNQDEEWMMEYNTLYYFASIFVDVFL